MSGLKSGDRGRAFTLVECLAALTLVSFILSLFFSPVKNALYAYRLYNERRIAESRICTVGAILRMPVFYCALGIPLEAAEYKKSFGSNLSSPFSWNGPISVIQGRDGEAGGCLRLAYGCPEPSRTLNEYGVGKTAAPLRFDAAANPNYFALDLWDKSKSVKNWVLFENSVPRRTPLVVTLASVSDLQLKTLSADEAVVPKGDRLLLFRAIECWALNDRLYTKDFRTNGDQPRENGVCDIRFYLNGDRSRLTVCLIVRGDDDSLAPGRVVGAEKCPEELLSQWRGRSRYVLYCARFTWPILNNRGTQLRGMAYNGGNA
ncbi:MAG: type II secretion system GspH family protein [Synergistaceae bacterium]|nr:type II secretion system GspH family protein [Synergistaceae bacterium]